MNQLKSRLKTRGFTLLELLYVMAIIGIIMPAMFALYNFMIKANREITARQSSIQQGYEFFERLNILVEDYRIDYEEYFNRQMVGCVKNGGTLLTGNSFERNVGSGGYCTEFTTYGNGNSTNRKEKIGAGPAQVISGGYHDLYYCTTGSIIVGQGIGSPTVVTKDQCGTIGRVQSYGQYAAMFTNVKEGLSNMVGDGDDEEVGYLINDNIQAIQDSNNIQELYLISQDGKNRLYLRRVLATTGGNYTQYKIQMLRLKGFDAGRKHNFDFSNYSTAGMDNRGVYDGVIDTWACDYSMGFEGHGPSIDSGGIYSDYHLPADVNDCWVDMTYGVTNVLAWNILVSPTGNPDLYWARQSHQINDYIKIFLVNGVYMPAYGGTMAESIANFEVPLQTSINMKAFYK